jgi:hypothetical protein
MSYAPATDASESIARASKSVATHQKLPTADCNVDVVDRDGDFVESVLHPVNHARDAASRASAAAMSVFVAVSPACDAVN